MPCGGGNERAEQPPTCAPALPARRAGGVSVLGGHDIGATVGCHEEGGILLDPLTTIEPCRSSRVVLYTSPRSAERPLQSSALAAFRHSRPGEARRHRCEGVPWRAGDDVVRALRRAGRHLHLPRLRFAVGARHSRRQAATHLPWPFPSPLGKSSHLANCTEPEPHAPGGAIAQPAPGGGGSGAPTPPTLGRAVLAKDALEPARTPRCEGERGSGIGVCVPSHEEILTTRSLRSERCPP